MHSASGDTFNYMSLTAHCWVIFATRSVTTIGTSWLRKVTNSRPFGNCSVTSRADYSQALARHYQAGPTADWQQRFVSEYASAHPWEDWAETWAHYLHITDTLETASSFRIVPSAPTQRRAVAGRQRSPEPPPDPSIK